MRRRPSPPQGGFDSTWYKYADICAENQGVPFRSGVAQLWDKPYLIDENRCIGGITTRTAIHSMKIPIDRSTALFGGRPQRWLVAIMLLQIVPFLPSRAQDSRENADFNLAINLFNDRMYDLASQQFKQFIAAYPNTSQGIEARFYLGQVQMQLKQCDDRRPTFQNFALSYVE